MIIKRVSEIDDRIGEFINKEFAEYGVQSGVELNFEEFHFVAEDEDGKVIGVITGRAYYNEVHIGDLIIDKNPKLSKYFFAKSILLNERFSVNKIS